MQTAIKGYYDHGHLTLEEAPPTDKTPVMVIFLNEDEQPKKRKLGGLEGKVTIPDDFNEPLEDLKDYM